MMSWFRWNKPEGTSEVTQVMSWFRCSVWFSACFFCVLRHFRSTFTGLGLLGHSPLTVREMNSAKNVRGRNLF